MEKMNYQNKGIVKLKAIINDANTLLRNVGEIDDKLEQQLAEQFKAYGVMDPKDSLLLYHLDTKARKSILTDEEKATREELRTKAEVARTYFKENCGLATIKDELAKRGFIPRLRAQQKKDARGNIINMNLIPPLWFFQRFDSELPTSIIAAQWGEFELDVTNEPALKVGLLSISYNNISKQYELHNWMTTYVLDTQKYISDIIDEDDEALLMD